jgi:hypothetical protein
MAYKIKRPHFTKRYARYRIEDPNKFMKSSLRTQDIGRKGHSKRIAGQLKSTGQWKTQAILISKKDYKEGTRVKKKYGKPVIVKEK